ncbi:MAG: hypothetical protein OEW35_12230 [Gammaproteobacteria bacterium]|nr:hypothetical protein [Gammaproteobacteria bacterium]MDH4253912.1 hypothetical protein [Gammaproteobacteria bacterium]MDH5310692.1 hypothetical protein [Gammaproteobacteria bacterium]
MTIRLPKLQQFDLRTRLLGFLCLVLAVTLLIEASVVARMPRVRAIEPAAAETEAPPGATVAPLPAMPPLAAYREVLQRPLFSDTRRPAEVAAPATRAPALAAPSTKWKLTGVVATGGESHAIVTGLRDKATLTLGQGDMLDGWQLVEIEPYQLTFEAHGSRSVLELRDEPPGT